jgi:hypothetical protein
LAHEFLWEYSCKRLKLAQLLGQLGVFLAVKVPVYPNEANTPSPQVLLKTRMRNGRLEVNADLDISYYDMDNIDEDVVMVAVGG